MRRFLLLSAILILVVACVPWVITGGPYVSPRQNISVELPEGWMRENTDEYLFITRDGPRLQYIMVETIHVDAELKHTKKKFRRKMLPQELAEVIIDQTNSNQEVLNFKVKLNKPTKIKGNPGFKLLYTYKDKDGLRFKCLYYGFLKGEWFYGIGYNAPSRYYFKKELEAFKKVLKSFQLIS